MNKIPREPARYQRAAQVGREMLEAGVQLTGSSGAATSAPVPQGSAALRLHRAPPDILTKIPAALAADKQVLPWRVEDGTLVVAVAQPLTPPDIAALALRVGMPVRLWVVDDAEALAEAIDINYRHVVVMHESPGGAPDQTAVRLADAILTQALKVRASDIHLEPGPDGVLVRFRVDGVLAPAARVPASQGAGLVAYFKVLAGLDYSQRGRPLDGHITQRVGRQEVDLRFSSIGTAAGLDKIVLRVLERHRALLTLADLGFTGAGEQLFRRLLDAKQGVVVAAGPTGSGKTTTLNAAVLELDAVQQNIVTLEDPVEAILPQVTQIPVSSAGDGVSFAQGLRAVLRQDPDIIVVGEMRDPETIAIAVQAALSGHMVLSSLHAIDAPSTIYRLLDHGVEPYLLAAALTGVVAQRLLRLVCDHCADERLPTPVEAAVFANYGRAVPDRVRVGRGCNHCNNTGFAGREAVYEVLPLTEDLRGLVARQVAPQTLREAADATGFVPMVVSALDKAAAGRTTVTEIARVLATREGS